jgi:ABC-type phosphate/phosphonate transport system substrate-binding protein
MRQTGTAFLLQLARRLIIITLICCLIPGAFTVRPGSVHAAENFHLSIGYTGAAYQDISNTDMKASVNVLMNKVAWKHFGRGDTRFYDSLTDMAADLKTGKIQVLAMPIEEFMAVRNRIPIDPILVTISENGHENELVLLVRKDSGIRSISGLRGRSLIMPMKNPRCVNIYIAWLEILLKREKSRMGSFFSTVKETRTVSKAVMPVFFRQADACVVTRQVLELTSELNPQISRELTVIASVDKLSQGIIAVDRRLSEEKREKIRESFLSLHQTPEGRQLLMLFKVNRLVPFAPGNLKATEALYAEYRALAFKGARRR